MSSLFQLQTKHITWAEQDISCSADVVVIGQNLASMANEFQEQLMNSNMLEFEQCNLDIRGSVMMPDVLRTHIASHPLYPSLVSAHIDCKKVGAPPEMASLLEDIGKENNSSLASSEVGADPELDDFMESYCKILQQLKVELTKPFDEATAYLNNIESQFNDLCGGTLVRSSMDINHSDEAAAWTSMRLNEVIVPQNKEVTDVGTLDKDLKEELFRKYSGFLTNLRKEFLKKRKKTKLPEDARMTLLEWWNTHYRWPYPTEEEKMNLSKVTGLDPKQINNWFINQRKRHWKPSEHEV